MTKLPNPYFEVNISDSLSAGKQVIALTTKEITKNNQNCLYEKTLSTQLVADEAPFAGKKLADAGHGSKFQSNLLILYSVRAIRFRYQFYLGNDLPDAGDKLDDLIFHYKDEEPIHSKDDKETSFRQQYLQAKQRLNVNKKITAANLLDENNGDLLKYFHSYVKIKSKGNNVEHCIICTNADLNYNNLSQNGISLEEIEHEKWPKLLDCTDVKEEQNCYRLVFGHEKFQSVSSDSKRSWVISKTREEMKYLFENCEDEMIKTLFVNCTDNERPFSDYTVDEIKDVFNNLQDKKEIQNLFQNMGETIVANIFEGFFVCFFHDFLDKLIFVVNMPNGEELDPILVKEVGNYFQLSNVALQSAYVMNKMVNWFKRQDNLWLTDKDAKNIIQEKTVELTTLIEITSISINYQKQLEKLVEFNNSAIEELVPYLKSLDEDSTSTSIQRIKHFSSETPKLTAAKVISAINMLLFQNKDDYLIISLNCLKENKEQWKNSLEVEKCHCLLVVVDEDANDQLVDDTYYENLVPKNSNKRVILISSQNFRKLKPSLEDRITYKQLSENTQKIIRKKKVTFLGSDLTINQLIDESQLEKILEPKLIKNLLQTNEDKTISMSLSSSSDFNQSLYIKRKIKFHLKDQLMHELAKRFEERINKEIAIDYNGKIQWLIQDDERKKEIWKSLKVLLERLLLDASLMSDVNDEELIDSSNKRIIITGVAGTGKSTVLSHYYKIIKEKKPDNLVIKISLNSFSKILKETNDIKKFLINNAIVQNSFARSLLKHRLETGDRIFLMLDGFDEIDNECQSKVIQLMKTLNESVTLYITTRPHLADKLQFELSQLAFSLDKLTEEDQTNYLALIWKDYLSREAINYKEEIIQTFAEQLIDRINKILKDKENEFIGVPLQCRILAECYQSKIKDEIIRDPNADLSHLIGGQQFDLVHLYKSLIDEKRRVFRQEKIRDNWGDNPIVNFSIPFIIKETEFHLIIKALQTIFPDQKDLDNLIPVGNKSEIERKEKEKQLDEFGIRFGVLDAIGENEVQFHHRTYAEYFVADYIYSGFLLDEENQNKLLDNEFARGWIIKEIFENCSNYEGVMVFFNSMMREILSNQQWKDKIHQRILPDRYQKFSRDLLCGDDKRETKTCVCGQTHLCWSLGDKKNPEIWVLTKALEGRNDNIILFILDCLDATIDETKIQLAIIHAEKSWKNFFSYRDDVFDRILKYFDKETDNENLKDALKKLGHAFKEMDEKQLKPQNVELFLDFMERHLEQVKLIQYRNSFEKMAAFIIPCESDNLKEKFLRIVRLYYSDDTKLIIKFMTSIISAHLGNLKKYFVQIVNNSTDQEQNEIEDYLKQENKKMGQIEKTLRTWEVDKRVTATLSWYILVTAPETLKRTENATIHSSLMDEMCMIGLYRAVSSGNLNTIQGEIKYSLENLEKYSKKQRDSVLRLMTNENDIVAPLDIAAAMGHEDICKKIMGMFDKKAFLSLKPFFLHAFLEYENVFMFQTILKSFKEVWDKNVLTKLLQSIFTDKYVSFSKHTTKRMIETMIKVFVKDEGYGQLNDLIFYNGETLRILECVNCKDLKHLITSAGEFEKWLTRLMNTDVHWTFHMLSSNDFLDKLKKMRKIPKLIDTLIKKRPPPILTWITSRWSKRARTQWSFKTSSSFWSSFVKRSTTWDIKKFLSQVSDCDEDTLKKLLFCRDKKNIVIIFHYFLREGSSLLSSNHFTLPENVKNQIEDLLQKENLQLINHYFFSTPTFLKSLDQYELLNAIDYYLKNGNQEQLSKFGQVVKADQLEKILQNTEYERCKTLAQLLREKLDSRMVFDYNHLIEKYNQ